MGQGVSNIKQAFIPKINYAVGKLQDCFSDEKTEYVKAEKYLKVIQDLYSQMILAIKTISILHGTSE